ncbi:MAG: hypothetical protein IPL61_23735 [Myxococcales bacterium]|nr:hypothetical protein [Myxococcales bacterium]
MTDDGPYRAPAHDRLGEVVRVFAVPRRPRYLGAGRAVGRATHMTLGSVALPPAATSSLSWLRAPRSEAVEVCARGLRVRSAAGVLELCWEQIAEWTAVTVDGAVVAIDLVGVHGERQRLGGALRDKDQLYALVAAGRAAPAP